MAPKPRKARSDSLQAHVAEARKPDTSMVPLPDLPALKMLGDEGMKFFADIYRADPGKFTAGDLAMLAQAAAVHESLLDTQAQLIGAPKIVALSNGSYARNPLITLAQDSTKLLQNLLRDLTVRSKDGAKPMPFSNTKPEASKNVTSFEDFLRG